MDKREEEKNLNNDTNEKLNNDEVKEVDPSTKGRLMVEEGRKRRRKRKKLFDFGLNLLQFAIVAVFVILVVNLAKYKLDNDRKSENGNTANNEKATNGDEDETGEGETVLNDDSYSYEIVINKKKHALIVRKISKGKDPEVLKVMKCNIGKNLKEGKHKINNRYSWVQTGDCEKEKYSTATHPGSNQIGFSTYFGGINDSYWSQYAVGFSDDLWIGSIYYTKPYKYYMVKEAYNNLGKYDYDGGCIQLCCRDAKWIFKHCVDGTKVIIENGKKSDALPLDFEELPATYSNCGWDPTDSGKQNPYKNAANGQLVANQNKVIIERGSEIDYLSNIICLNENGKDVTNKLKYDETTSAAEDEHVVEYTYKKKDGTKLKTKIKYKIVDTMPPIVRFTSDKKEDYVIETKENYEDKLTNDKIKKKIADKLKEVINASDLGAREDNEKIEFNYPKKIKFGENIIRMSIADYYGNTTYFNAVINVEYAPK